MRILRGDSSFLCKIKLITIWKTYCRENLPSPQINDHLSSWFILRGWERSWGNFLLYNSSATFLSNLSDLPKYSFSFLPRYNFVDTSIYDIYDLLPSVIYLPIFFVFLSPKEHEGKDLNWCISEFPKISYDGALHLVSAYLVTAAVVQWYKRQRTADRAPFPCIYREQESWGLGHLLLKEKKKDLCHNGF